MKRFGFFFTVGLLAPASAHAQESTSGQPTQPTPTATAAPAVPPPAPVAAGGQKEQGFVLETHFYATIVSFAAGVGTTLNLPLITGGFFAGYKLDRLMLGLGYNFTSYDAGGGAQIVMTWAPGVRFDLLQTDDKRVDLFLQFDFGVGHDFGSNQSNEIFSPDLGLGVRYWVHKQFAFSAVSGWDGVWNVGQNPSTSVVLMGIFGGLQVTGVF